MRQCGHCAEVCQGSYVMVETRLDHSGVPAEMMAFSFLLRPAVIRTNDKPLHPLCLFQTSARRPLVFTNLEFSFDDLECSFHGLELPGIVRPPYFFFHLGFFRA